jgi:hypothetical protein
MDKKWSGMSYLLGLMMQRYLNNCGIGISHQHLNQESLRLTIRDGLPPWFKMLLPRWLIPQRLEPNLALCKAMKEKLGKVRCMGYLAPGEIKSLTSFFAVPKGDSDIGMVYDGTKSDLNDAMWAPLVLDTHCGVSFALCKHRKFLRRY